MTTPLLWLTAAAVVLIFFGGGTARNAYFALTYFHVGLEAAALARAGLARRTQPRSIGAQSAPLSEAHPQAAAGLIEVAA